MSEQFEMKRTQHVSFNREQSKTIDDGRKIAGRFSAKPISVNRFVKVNAIARAKEILEAAKND
ncbi:hypothetical protein ACHHY8_21780 [Enterobacter cloacae complex sp. 2024EL-00215]|nr:MULTISPECIES: hypothetical protein [Pectobacterium]HCT5765282.1 hypothetical protein [Klebsiella variicola]HDG9833887.1 hypothetical protein [Raoultella ornithinolytica]HDZ2201566.1 hypothetical protein [Klebsiella pneumoniae]POD90680.1 hypothetical protein BV925_16890 [Pectobacterium odoriferum]QSD34049.1 hypothetical protein H5A40_13200 [Pectobacterium brasiliense]